MTKTNKLFSLLIALIMLITSMPITAYAAVKAPAKPTSISASSTVNTITVKWKKVSGAKGYTVYRYNTSNKKSYTVGSTKKAYYTISKLSSGSTYVYYVKAYKLNGKKKVYSKASSKVTVSTLPLAVKNFKVSSVSDTTAKLSWSKVTGATSYKVQYTTDKNFKNGVKSVTLTATTKTITSLKQNTKYYFRIYAIRTVNKKNYTSAVSSTNVTTNKTVSKTDTSKYSTIDENTKYQQINGFGASAAWWSKKVGTWTDDEGNLDENAKKVLDYLYGTTNGIGLNIYRYNLGAGSQKGAWSLDENGEYVYNSGDDTLINSSNSAESFVKSYDSSTKTFTYDFENNDVAAQKVLKYANSISNNMRVTLFCNSAPVEITSNGKAYGYLNSSGQGTQNLLLSQIPQFADYVTTCADYFVYEGYNVTDVSPINEPQYSWSTNKNSKNNQEGCYYDSKTISSVYKQMILKAKDKPYKISMFESGSVEGQYEVNNDGSYALNSDGSKKSTTMSKYLDAIMSNKTCEEYFTSISTHSYWSSTATKKAAAQYLCANYPNLSVACTEYCQMTNDENSGVFDLLNTLEGVDRNGYTIDFGIAMAKVMYDDLTILNATEWDWWTACSNGIYTDGLVYIDNSDHSNIKTSKRLWCLGNYSKFIDEGAVRVKITENQASILSSAYKNPDGSLVIVYINEGKSDMTVNINASGYKTYDTYVTDASRDLELYQSGTYSVKNNVTIPARSVTTVVLK